MTHSPFIYAKENAHIILIDNFDSFTYNLVDAFRVLGHRVTIYRNNLCPIQIRQAILSIVNPVLVLSPGPGAPSQAGCMLELILSLKGKVPMIGICLGQQAINQAYGGKISHAGHIMHGKASLMEHYNHPIFNGLENPLTIARYHSLVASYVPDSLNIIARADNLVMAIANESDNVVGYQFHPESILTTKGAHLLKNTLSWVTRGYK